MTKKLALDPPGHPLFRDLLSNCLGQETQACCYKGMISQSTFYDLFNKVKEVIKPENRKLRGRHQNKSKVNLNGR